MSYLYYPEEAAEEDSDAVRLLASFGSCEIEVTADQEARLDGLHETFRAAARTVVLSCNSSADRTASIRALRTALFFAQEAVSAESAEEAEFDAVGPF